MRASRLVWLLVTAGIAAALAVRTAGRFLVVADPLPAHADALVVLAGSIADRALEAADLYRTGIAPVVVITRERAPTASARLRARGVVLPESDALLRQALLGLGVPADAIVRLRRRTSSTETEARTIARWACRHGVRRLVVVTSKAHTRRARLILRRALGPTVTLTIRPARDDPFPAARWWRVRHAAKVVLVEYEKLADYWLAERWRIPPCGGLTRRERSGRGARVLGDRSLDHRPELAARVQLAHDVAAADELPADEHLRQRGPVAERFHRLALCALGEDVDRLVRHPDLVEHLDGGGREAAHREARRALHVDHHGVLPHLAGDLVQHVAHPAFSSGGRVRSASAWMRGMRSSSAA
jgi:uncharacterized SAM-binding protein YcdF (DUF218 family)